MRHIKKGLQKVNETRGTAEYILQRELGHYANLDQLAREAVDLLKADRILIKILGRNIESLTMQMKAITDVTFERDTYKRNLERQMNINNYLREKLKKYEEN